MRKILKKFGVGMLVMSLALTLPPNYSINTKMASAEGGTKGDDAPSADGGHHVSGTATVTGYGFRVSLRDIRAAGEGANKAEKAHAGKLWKVKSGSERKHTAKYIMKKGKDNSADRLEWDAKTNGLYLGLSKSSVNCIYSEASGKYVSVDDDRIVSDKGFGGKNGIPGLASGSAKKSNYSSAGLKGANARKKVKWSPYAKKFNKLSKQMDKKNGDGAQDVIDWFSKKGLLGSGKSHFLAAKTIVVVEPYVIWTFSGAGEKVSGKGKNKKKRTCNVNYLMTFQSALCHAKETDKLDTIFKTVYAKAGGINLSKVKSTKGKKTYYNPSKAQKSAQNAAKRVAVLGGFYQSEIHKKGDCVTKAFDETSGYGCYGTKHTDKTTPDSLKVSANVSVVYKGGFNFEHSTQAASTNTDTYRTIKLKGEQDKKSVNKTLKVSNKKETWNKTKGNKNEKLGFPKTFKADEYSTIFSGTFMYSPKNGKKTYSRLYSCTNVTKKMKGVEGNNPTAIPERDKLLLQWGKIPVSNSLSSDKSDRDVLSYGNGASVKSISFRPEENNGLNWVSSEPIAKYINSNFATSDNGVTRKNAEKKKGVDLKNRPYKVAEKNTVDYAGSGLSEAFDAKARTDKGKLVRVSDTFTEKSGIKKGKRVGLSAQLMVKNKQVDDYVATYKISKDGVVSLKTDTKKHWQIASLNPKQQYYSKVKPSKYAVYMIAVPNYDTTKSWSSNVDSGLKSKLTEGTSGITDSAELSSKYISNFRSYFANDAGVLIDSDGETLIESSDIARKELRFGSAGQKAKDSNSTDNTSVLIDKTLEGDELYGYSVYILEVEDPAVIKGAEGTLNLKDYEINHVFRSMCEEATNNGSPLVVTLRKDLVTVDLHEKTPACEQGSYWYPYPTADSYNLVITEKGSKGKTIEKDDSLSGTKMLLSYDSLFHFDTRTNLLAGRVFDSRDYHKVDYAFNLSRGVFGDSRTVSTISDQTLDETFAEDVLDLDYGDTPQTITKATANRNSKATVGGQITDTFKFDAIYKATGSKTKYTKVYNVTHTDWFGSGEHSWTRTHSCEDVQEHSNELVAFNILKGSISTDVATVTINMDSTANKYQTEANETGKNTKVPDSKYLREELQKPKTGSNGMTENLTIGSEKTGYATAYVKNSETVLSFYPEVPMQAMEYSGGKRKQQ